MYCAVQSANCILFHAFHVDLQLRLPVSAAQHTHKIEIAYLLSCHNSILITN